MPILLITFNDFNVSMPDNLEITCLSILLFYFFLIQGLKLIVLKSSFCLSVYSLRIVEDYCKESYVEFTALNTSTLAIIASIS